MLLRNFLWHRCLPLAAVSFLVCRVKYCLFNKFWWCMIYLQQNMTLTWSISSIFTLFTVSSIEHTFGNNIIISNSFFDKFSNFPFITFIVKVILSHGAKQQLITILHTRHIKRDEKIGLICTNNPKVFEIISVIYLMVSC